MAPETREALNLHASALADLTAQLAEQLGQVQEELSQLQEQLELEDARG